MSDHHHDDKEDACDPEYPEKVICRNPGMQRNDPLVISFYSLCKAPVEVTCPDMNIPFGWFCITGEIGTTLL
jgi:hypothetical protein